MSDEKQPDSHPNFQPPDPCWKGLDAKINPEWRTATHVFAGDELLRPTPLLSVLLATVESRAALFEKLHAEITRQSEGRSVELIVACDNKEISIGKKRQNLLAQATGDYICFVDDDDWIAPDYIDSILSALEFKPDCVGFKIHCTTNGMNPQSAITSMRYKQWRENFDGYAHVRSIYHKSPILRSIALKVGFPDLRYGEDRPFSAGVMRHVQTEAFIDKVLYFYRFHTEPFAAKYGIKHTPKTNRYSHRPQMTGKIKRDKNGRPV